MTKYPTLLATLLATLSLSASAQDTNSPSDLLFYLSAEQGATADIAAGDPLPNMLNNIFSIEDGAVGKALHCADRQIFSYYAPGNIYAKRGTLAFYWRGAQAFTHTEFPIFRVSFADHTSWDMVWLRIDYNGHGFDAFVTDNNLARIRVSVEYPVPDPQAWTHFALSWDESTGIRFYLNGKQVASQDRQMALDTGLDQFGPHSRIISPYQVQSAYTMQRGGDIDELRIYSRMLSDSEVALIAQNLPIESQTTPSSPESDWARFYGFGHTLPPYLSSGHTSIKDLGLLESYDELRWYWKAFDGIRETTWPGVYNRSRIEGRNDYFQLPDWDCSSTSGINLRVGVPEEDWNYIEITGGAHGLLSYSKEGPNYRINDNSDILAGSRIATKSNSDKPREPLPLPPTEPLSRKPQGSQRSFHLLDAPRHAGTLIFTNDIQETPIQELKVFNISSDPAPQGICRLSYSFTPWDNHLNPQLIEIEDFVRGRYFPGERTMLLGSPTITGTNRRDTQAQRDVNAVAGTPFTGGSNPFEAAVLSQGPKSQEQVQPIAHLVIPSDTRDLSINRRPSIKDKQQDFGEFGSSWNSTVRSCTWEQLHGGLDGILIELPALPVKPGSDQGLYPLNIQIKDPIWPLRNLSDVSFSIKPGEARSLYIDLRDRILPEGKPLYLSIVGADKSFQPSMLAGLRVSLIFKDYDSAKQEHIADRFTQVRDCYAMIVEEASSSRKLSKFAQFDADIRDLLRVDPAHKLGRQYWALHHREQVAPEYHEPTPPKGVPAWAFYQLEVLKKFRSTFEWFIDNRQLSYGEFSGGISDDTDLTNHFPALYALGCAPSKFAGSLGLFMSAVDAEGTLTDGMSTIQSDGLHTYEEGVNTVSQYGIVNPGSPNAAERLMESALAVRDRLLGVNSAGHTHFRSDYFSATKIADQGIWTWSSNREYYHTAPALILGDLYGNSGAREYILRFADSTLAHARKDARGNVSLPAELNFITDEARSWGRGYANPMMWYAWRWTGDKKYLEPVLNSGWLPVSYTKESLERTMRAELRAIAAREYIMTEGSLWIDRIGFSCVSIQDSRMGGVMMNRSEHLAPSNLINWEFPQSDDAEKLGILVTNPALDGFEIEFFNTAAKPINATLRGQIVLGGEWELSLPDGKTRRIQFGREKSVSLSVPPMREYKISMRLVGPGREDCLKPDLGIGSEDISITTNNIGVTVHNLGSKDISSAVVALIDSKGKTLAEVSTDAIPSPGDLKPKTTSVSIPIPAGIKSGSYTIAINPGREDEEIYSSNNRVAITL